MNEREQANYIVDQLRPITRPLGYGAAVEVPTIGRPWNVTLLDRCGTQHLKWMGLPQLTCDEVVAAVTINLIERLSER